jgi:hypothetical protein
MRVAFDLRRRLLQLEDRYEQTFSTFAKVILSQPEVYCARG